jgi:segregation and condensation protein A
VTINKPFYLQHPWQILFETHKLTKAKPWSIDISFLLDTFLEEMAKLGEVDFRASGVALDSSSLIYLMKSRLLLKLEDPPKPPKPSADFTPPPIFLPLRYELTSTTFEQLLEALDSALKAEKLPPSPIKFEPPLPSIDEILPQFDQYLAEIEDLMDNLYADIVSLLGEQPFIVFNALIEDQDPLRRIQTFILLLFLAQKGRIRLWQEEEFSDIYLSTRGNLLIDEN